MKMTTRGSSASGKGADGKSVNHGCKEVSTQTMLNMSELDRIMLLFLCPRTEASTQTEGTCLEALPVFDVRLDLREDHTNMLHDDSCETSRYLSSGISDDSQDCDTDSGGVAGNETSVEDKHVYVPKVNTDDSTSKEVQNNLEKESAVSGKGPLLTPRTSKRLALKKKLSFSSSAKSKSGRKSKDVSKHKSPTRRTKEVDAIDDEAHSITDQSTVDRCSGKKGVVSSNAILEPSERTSDEEMSPSEQSKTLDLHDSEDRCCNVCNETDCKCTDRLSPLPVDSPKRVRTCKFCSKKFRDVGDFMRHNRMHTKEKPHQCEECGSRFRWKASYVTHLRQVHKMSLQEPSPAKKDDGNNEVGTHKKGATDKLSKGLSRRKRQKRTFKCESCGKVLRCLANLNRHLLTHTGTRPFQCNQCPRAFTERSGLKNHVLRRHSEKQHVCDLCGKHFGSIVFLKQHRKVHTKQREEFVCKLCEKVYTTAIALDIHMLAHAGLKPFVCDMCGRRLYSKYQLNRHMKRHYSDQGSSTNKKRIKPKSHVCSVCSKAFASSSRLQRHLSTVHCTVREQQCPTCHKVYPTASAMRKHVKDHNEGPYQCEVCERWWLTKDTYSSHMRLHFGRTSSKVFVCVHCNMGFFHMIELDDHYKSHAEDTTFRCMHCEKIFKSQEELVTHRSIHPNQKVPLNCGRCDKLFATLQELRAHERCHDKPLECVVCDLTFPSEESAKEHMQCHVDDGSVLSTTVLMYKCPKCGKLFTNRGDYDSHALVHEGTEYVCSFCDIGFESAIDLENHTSSHAVVKLEEPEGLNSTGELAEHFKTPPVSGSDVPQIHVLGQVQLQNPVNLEALVAADTMQAVIQYETGHNSENDVSVCQTLQLNDEQEGISCTVCGKKFLLIENFLSHCQDHPEIEVTVKTL
ncbi:zinc finger protein 93-like [Gigantopelta aegis]|uniref:zinc finger protein 93-like n=1 Tax=Gigantopelta aegis TaxID=1735272 RepID=UPI001B88B949|nr:zinc finger protein 93-like [Gigantopelta aegis]